MAVIGPETSLFQCPHNECRKGPMRATNGSYASETTTLFEMIESNPETIMTGRYNPIVSRVVKRTAPNNAYSRGLRRSFFLSNKIERKTQRMTIPKG